MPSPRGRLKCRVEIVIEELFATWTNKVLQASCQVQNHHGFLSFENMHDAADAKTGVGECHLTASGLNFVVDAIAALTYQSSKSLSSSHTRQ